MNKQEADFLEDHIKKAQKGDKKAFEQAILLTQQSMYRVAISILQRTELCADAMQESILKAYRSLHTLKEPKYFKSWLIRIVINESNFILRQQKKIISLHGLDEPSYSASFTTDLELKEAISLLTEDYRTVIILYYFEDLAVKEIAEVLDLPLGTVKNKLFRARNQLANYLQEERSLKDYER